VIVVDTSLVVALLNRADSLHARAARWVAGVTDELVTTPLAVAEMDHLVARHGGPAGSRALWRDLARGAYAVEWWPSATADTVAVAEASADRGLGLADASLVALAARVGTVRIATFDERHFRTVRPLDGGERFVLAPLDES
jgi:uncharacterized protein